MENIRLQTNKRTQTVVRLVARSGLLVLWAAGIRIVVLDGFEPSGFGGQYAYPAQDVFINCVILTLQGVLVYAVLRPGTLSDHPERVFAAFVLMCYLFSVDYYARETSNRDAVNTTMIFVGYNMLAIVAASLAVIVGFFLKIILKRRPRVHFDLRAREKS